MQLTTERVAQYNDLSKEFRDKINSRLRTYGTIVRYKFSIGNPNPDPLKEDGEIIYPGIYTLDPAKFSLNDKDEKRENVSKQKQIALVDLDSLNDKGVPEKFGKIKVNGSGRGFFDLNLSEEGSEDWHKAFLLELHPKHEGGLFQDTSRVAVFSRIDETKQAESNTANRNLRRKALNAVADMDDKAVRQYADAMMWDSTEPITVLRDRIEGEAETAPEMFMNLIEGKSVELQALVKRALDKKILAYDPGEAKVSWFNNRQLIATFSPNSDKNVVENMAEWLQTGGKNAEEVLPKIKELLK